MNLKSFHILFIVFAVIVTLIFGAWALQYYAYSKTPGYLITAIGSFVVAAGLSIYAVLVAKKLKIY